MTFAPRLLLVCVTGCLVGCAAHTPPVASAPPRLPPVSAAVQVPGRGVALTTDPSFEIIQRAEREFAAGVTEQSNSHLVAAREHFDAAIDILLAVPGGARSTPRLSAEYDELLDRISAVDVLALREGDGFTEARSEPAAIDELLGAAVFERPAPALTTEETVRADLQRSKHDLDIPINDRVLSFVELFQGRLHDFTQAALERGVRYLPMIKTVFQQEQIPLDLAYVPIVESAFKANALSKARARGMWQFISTTGQEHGLDQNWYVDERSDPEKATHAAAEYLKSLRDFFDGDWDLALASYNAGPGRVQTAITRAKTADYWELSRSTRFLPRETRDYVPMIMAAIVIATNPSLYGFDVSGTGGMAYEQVTVPDALDLKIIAEWIDVSVDDLRELNPELRRTTTPGKEYALKVPVGTAATVQDRLTTASALYVHPTFYIVQKNDTVTTIARKYKISTTELRDANDLTVRSKLSARQQLMIPQRAASSLPSSSVVRTAAAAPARPAAPTGSAGTLTYRVQRGDTLYSIARHFDTTVDTIRRLNELHNDRINIGDRLTVRR